MGTAAIITRPTITVRRWDWKGTTREAWQYNFLAEGEAGEVRFRRSGFPSRADAVAAAKSECERIRKEGVQARAEAQDATPTTLHEALAAFTAGAIGHLAPRGRSSVLTDLSAVAKALPDRPLARLSGRISNEYLEERREEVSPYTLRRQLATLHRALGWCVRQGFLPRHPMGASPPRVRVPDLPPVALDEEGARRLLALSSGRLRVCVALALGCGLRLGEVLSRRWADVSLGEEVVLRVCCHEGFTTKSKKSRTLALPGWCVRILREHRDASPPSPWLLPAEEDPSRPMPEITFRRAWNRLRVEAGAPALRYHYLRHSCAVMLATHGASGSMIQAVLGHADLATSEKYLRGHQSLALSAARHLPDLA